MDTERLFSLAVHSYGRSWGSSTAGTERRHLRTCDTHMYGMRGGGGVVRVRAYVCAAKSIFDGALPQNEE